MRICFLGPPCAGKSTIARAIQRETDWRYLSTGDVARSLASRDEEARLALEVGAIAPSHKMDAVLFDNIRTDVAAPLLVDGYPRYMEQLADLAGLLRMQVPLLFVEVQIDEMTALNRQVLRARRGEGKAAFMNRYRYYHSETMRVLDYVRARSPEAVFSVDGTQHISASVRKIHAWIADYERRLGLGLTLPPFST